jgi:hypothetical protein
MVLAVAVVDGGTLVGEGKRRRTEEGGVGGFGDFGEVRERLFGGQGNGKTKFEQFFFNWA